MTLPDLHLADWRATKDILHLYCQILGKIRLATTAPRNHWWNVPLYVESGSGSLADPPLPRRARRT
jgi:hypothetical protein